MVFVMDTRSGWRVIVAKSL